ncbi:pyridoxal phosphate-dependent aminotransferase [Nocardia sp. NPDC006044]|uniref:pyridoxal phosphate-dependent aminotransferase n=1 Tax=Nocardia sp. NPDC006044 TaxID=3364306 RepID=UPI003692ABCE
MTSFPRPDIASKVARMASGQLFRMLSEARASNAIDLALGAPETPHTSSAMIDAAHAVLRGGQHNQYADPLGNPLLRKQIADTYSPAADPDTELTITVGATEALHTAVLTVVEPGDEVILFEPIYDNFLSAIALAGGIPRLIPLSPPHWRHDPAELRAAFGPRTRVIIVSTPNNPTGHMLSRAEWTEIAELCQRWNAVVISDEIYSGYVFDGHRHISAADIPGLRDRYFIAGSLSKSHAICGWRIGYLRATAALTAAARQVHIAVCGGTAAPLQEAVARAAAADPDFPRPGTDLRAQRDRTIEMFDQLDFRCVPPDGGCYVMADITSFTDADSETLAERLLRHVGVLVVPGRYFYLDDSEHRDAFVRVAFNRSMSLLDAAEQRLSAVASRGTRTLIGSEPGGTAWR